MRSVAFAFIALALMASPAMAWEEYQYPEQGFAIQFPVPPAIEAGTYDNNTGPAFASTVYSVTFENVLYRLTVIELGARADEGASLIGEIAHFLERDTQIVMHYFPRIGFDTKPSFGAGILVDRNDGSRLRSSAYVFGGRFYRADAIVLPARGDLDQSVPSRFDQTLRFDVGG
jgi:hypothetical protein